MSRRIYTEAQRERQRIRQREYAKTHRPTPEQTKQWAENGKARQVLEQEYLREMLERQAEREALEALEPPKVGQDPNRPWHPVFNPEPPRAESGCQMMLRDAQYRLGLTKAGWDGAVSLIKAGRFNSRKEIAAHYGKPREWAGMLVNLLVDRAEITADDLRLLRRRKRTTNNQTNTQ